MIELENDLNFSNTGGSFLIYGKTDSGKTCSVSTCEDPILHMNTEAKDARLVINQIAHGKKIKYVRFESFDDQQTCLNQWLQDAKDGKFPAKTIMYDGLTFGQIDVKHAIEDDRAVVRKEDKDWRGVIDSYRFERPDWGSMASMMDRTTNLLVKFTAFGITVICTALEDSNYPKWGQGLRIGPSLTGQDYSKRLAGYFHFIGYIVSPYVNSTPPTLPRVSFCTEDDGFGNDYVARCSSNKLRSMGPAPLDFARILKVIRS